MNVMSMDSVIYPKNLNVSMKARYRFSAVVEKEDNVYIAHCPDVGVTSQGKTIEGALANLKEAVELYLEHAEPEEKEHLKRFMAEKESIMATITI